MSTPRTTPGFFDLHRFWSSTADSPHNWPGDKRKWQEIESRYLDAERLDDQKEMAHWVDVARRFAQLCNTGSTTWDGYRPRFLED